jgi:hypothetical protein
MIVFVIVLAFVFVLTPAGVAVVRSRRERREPGEGAGSGVVDVREFRYWQSLLVRFHVGHVHYDAGVSQVHYRISSTQVTQGSQAQYRVSVPVLPVQPPPGSPAVPMVLQPSAVPPGIAGRPSVLALPPGNIITRSIGGSTVDTHAMADEIRSMGRAEFSDPQDIHDTVSGGHEIVAALQEVLNGWGFTLAETGVHPAYAEAMQEAAVAMSGVADQLASITSGGVMRGPGG